MPAASQRELLLDALIDRLEAITVVGGFNTNAGQAVHLGELPVYGDDSDPAAAIAVVVEDDDVKQFQHKGLIDLPLSIQAFAKVTTAIGLRLAYRDAERVLADIKRAVELPDRTMGGLVKWLGLERGTTTTLKREAGSQFVGIAINYVAQMHETWGAP